MCVSAYLRQLRLPCLQALNSFRLALLHQVLLLVAIIILDGLLGLDAGVLRGAGLPEAAARINLFCYWIFGLPLGAFATWRLRSIAGL